MSINAYLPCFKCGKILENVFVECDNQPYSGTEFRTEGHYGSTFWDSFDGEDLVLNICDDCLREYSKRLGQQKRYLPVRCKGMVGFGRVAVERPLVAYTGNPDNTEFVVDVDSLGEELDDVEVEWVDDISERRAHLQGSTN
jgi:hypothetical protein